MHDLSHGRRLHGVAGTSGRGTDKEKEENQGDSFHGGGRGYHGTAGERPAHV